MDVLEIYTDASIRTFNNGRIFGCSGALCPTTNESRCIIVPDTTNNRSELLAIYLGVQLANEIINRNNNIYSQIFIYSDSQFSIFGLTRWINQWLKTIDKNGIMYGSNNKPVKNQELFAMILSYITVNNLNICFRHQAGHVRYTSVKMLAKANETFYKSNGYYLKPEDIYKISYYNDLVDKTTRSKLDGVNPNDYPISTIDQNNNLVRYIIPKDFKYHLN